MPLYAASSAKLVCAAQNERSHCAVNESTVASRGMQGRRSSRAAAASVHAATTACMLSGKKNFSSRDGSE
eukprot:7386261-Prymnesium_polylepis.5